MIPRLIVALDAGSASGALALIDALGDECDFYKIGSELFTAEGPPIVEKVIARGKDVFLDLKFHDIPATVRGAARSAAALGARLLTVHASGGRAMIEAALEGAGSGCGVLGVTILTSLAPDALADAWGRPTVNVAFEVKRLATLTHSSGARGIVCAGSELGAVQGQFGDGFELVVPGLRMAGGAGHDQARVVTPREAADGGATYLVLGRSVTAEASPAEAIKRVRASLMT